MRKKTLIGPAETEDLYLDIENLNPVLTRKKSTDIFIVHVNARSWVKNFDSFTSLFDRMAHPPEILCITETRLKDSKLDWQKNVTKIRNYDPIKYDNSPTDAGAGVLQFM